LRGKKRGEFREGGRDFLQQRTISLKKISKRARREGGKITDAKENSEGKAADLVSGKNPRRKKTP